MVLHSTLVGRTTSGSNLMVHGTVPVDWTPGQAISLAPVMAMRTAEGGPFQFCQQHVVAMTRTQLVLEVNALIPTASPSGVYELHTGQATTVPSVLSQFDARLLAMFGTPGALKFTVKRQDGTTVSFDTSTGLVRVHRFGPSRLTLEYFWHSPDPTLTDLRMFADLHASASWMALAVVASNDNAVAKPDVYLDSVKLELAAPFTWETAFVDPGSDSNQKQLVKAGLHCFPQRSQRVFRLVVRDPAVVPYKLLRAFDGWTVSDRWRTGARWWPHEARLPTIARATLDAKTDADWATEKDRLAALLPSNGAGSTDPNAQPPDALWPTTGIKYGGMTGGVDMYQYDGADGAMDGNPKLPDRMMIEQLRYLCRMRSGIRNSSGAPIRLEDYRNADGTIPWVIFNHAFQTVQNQVKDAPFYYSLQNNTPPPGASCPYLAELLSWSNIDHQHGIRSWKSSAVLAWLCNDPLSKDQVAMQFETTRMNMYDGPGGSKEYPSGYAVGVGDANTGRAEAWAMGAAAHVWCLGGPEAAFGTARGGPGSPTLDQARAAAWLTKMVANVSSVQLPSGLIFSKNTDKIATDPPFNGLYYVGLTNEDTYLLWAIRAADRGPAIAPGASTRANLATGVSVYAWKVGNAGPYDHHPDGPNPAVGSKYATKADWPGALVTIMAGVADDGFHSGTLVQEVQDLIGSTQANAFAIEWRLAVDLAAAKASILADGTKDLSERVTALEWAQRP